MSEYRLVLGLEVHLHLRTARKMFCGCDANYYNDAPNTHTCPVCLALPGALPVPNFEAIEKAQLLGLALHSELNKESRFDRKHYFYPDLPKGYQISQYKQPFCVGGYLALAGGKIAEMERVHLEEDTAKSFHQGGRTYIDFNKSGTPLVEIVTKPVFTDTADAVDFCKQVQEIVRTLDISDVDMEKGQMRLEANISLRTVEEEKQDMLPNYKVEIKNINSFKFMEKAVKSEIVRQEEILKSGGKVLQENRGYDEFTGKTVSQREKESAHDYRYFPEPDIPPMSFDQIYIDALKKRLPELPYEKKARYRELGVTPENAAQLSLPQNKTITVLFETLIAGGQSPQKTATLLINKPEVRELAVEEIIKRLQHAQEAKTSEDDLAAVTANALKNNPKSVEDYKKGKTNAVEFLLGQIMRETKGRADSQKTRELIIKLITG